MIEENDHEKCVNLPYMRNLEEKLYILLAICEFLNGMCDHDVCFNIKFKMEEMMGYES